MLVNNNKNMQVKLDVSFPSGAKVELSKGEVERVTKFINEMLFTTVKAEPAVKKRKKVKNYTFWTEADTTTLSQINSMPTGPERTRAIKLFSLQSGHSRPSIQTRIYRLRTEQKKATPVFFH